MSRAARKFAQAYYDVQHFDELSCGLILDTARALCRLVNVPPQWGDALRATISQRTGGHMMGEPPSDGVAVSQPPGTLFESSKFGEY